MPVYLNCDVGTGKPAARLGDEVNCPIHGVTSIISGSPNTNFEKRPAARVGDKTACGDTIIEGSSSVFVNGRPAAFVGCATAHGGKIISGSPTVYINTHNAPDTAHVQQSDERYFSLLFDFSEMHKAGNHNDIVYVNMPVMITKTDGTYITTIRTDDNGMTTRFYTKEQEEIVAWANSGFWSVTEEFELVNDKDFWEAGDD
jgi:uncharacterized Zn-binding protein involved in type VI secretion